MKKKQLTIDDLLAALKDPASPDTKNLENTKDTWFRIGEKDSTLAADIGVEESELDSFLKEWIADNPYNAI